jgi:hypothetical protein
LSNNDLAKLNPIKPAVPVINIFFSIFVSKSNLA